EKAFHDLEHEKKQLTGILETLRNKYKWQPRLEELRTTYEQVLRCFAKDSSHTPDQILGYLEDSSQTSLLGDVIRHEFGPQFQAFCQYLRTLADYVRKDPMTDEYMVQAIPKPRLIHHKLLTLKN